MLFHHNKYTQIYYNIINRAKSRSSSGYVEKHHIIPKSLGGSNDSTNIVILTAREHFICHWLLTKMCIDKNHHIKMLCAFEYMLYVKNAHQNRYKISSHIYETIKITLSAQKSQRMSGTQNPMFGKRHSDETKQKISVANKGRRHNHTAETREKISKTLTGIKRSDEFKKKVSENHKGKIESPDTRLKKSRARTGKKHSKETLQKLSDNSGRAKPIEINGVKYKSMKQAAQSLFPELPLHTGIRRIKSYQKSRT